jgi:hypothetical protein
MPQSNPSYGRLTNSLRVNQHIGTKYAPALNKVMFSAANTAGVTLSAGLATTYVGLCLSNPAASTSNLLLRQVAGSCIVAPAAFLALGLITGFVAGGITAHTTPLTPVSSFVGDSGVPFGKADSACTLVGTPAWAQWFTSEAATGNNPLFSMDLAGGLLIPPGGYAAVGANVAGPASGFLGSMEWIEVPIATP